MNPIITPTNLRDFLDGHSQCLTQQNNNKSIRTGYSNLDSQGPIYPGIYVLGGIPAIGKTTFAHQMADQMAQAGHKVLYFSLEQTCAELASKSLARIIKQSFQKRLSALSIRTAECNNEVVIFAMEQCKEFAANISIVEGSFETTADDIAKCTCNFIEAHQITPVVFVDYLQVIKSESTGREAVDDHLKVLKRLQKDNQLILVIISALNRQNYTAQIDLESFKESGGIEYTADVLWGLQYKRISQKEFNSTCDVNMKRNMIREEQNKFPRQIELVCLKNRYGKSGYRCEFHYYTESDVFNPVT